MFFREKGAVAVQNRVTIGGRDFSFNRDDGIEARYPFRASYNANVYTEKPDARIFRPSVG